MKEENRGQGGLSNGPCHTPGWNKSTEQLSVTRRMWSIQSGRGNRVCEGPESDIGRHICQLLLCNK